MLRQGVHDLKVSALRACMQVPFLSRTLYGLNQEHERTAVERVLNSPETVLLGSFAGVILIGAIILGLPWCHRADSVHFLDALFTATSAVCVTGLTVVDTGTDYTVMGQSVILALIQVGGLGVMTFAALAFRIAGWRMSLQSQKLVSDSFFQRDLGVEFRSSFKIILLMTLSTEAVGAFLLFLLLPRFTGTGTTVFSSVFHSVSAFCNAGFSLHSDSLIGIRDSTGTLLVVMGLITLGGLGYTVNQELLKLVRKVIRREKDFEPNTFSLNTRLVLTVSAVLVVGGSILILVSGLTPDEISWHDKVRDALFQSVTARTAGFNSVDIGSLPTASLFTLIVLMFIGGSPGSCAGGVKTTLIPVWLARLRASMMGKQQVRLLDRSLSQDLVSRVDLLLGLAVLWNMFGILVLFITQTHFPTRAIDLVFEQISAFGTVGLSTGLTVNLSTTGKLWIVATMFVGRLGPLTVALWMFPKSKVNVRYPVGSVMIG